MTYDFYFSEKHYEYLLNTNSMIEGSPYAHSYFNGKEYTECISSGQVPLTNHFGDLQFLGSGTMDDISFGELILESKEEVL